LYWWLYPSRVVFFVLMPIYLACSSFDAADYLLYKHYNIFLKGESVWLGFAGLVAFALSAFCAELGIESKRERLSIEARDLGTILACLYAVTLLAYAIFLSPIVFNPQIVVELAAGSVTAASALRDVLERIPGLTTLSTLQSLCVVVHLLYRRTTGTTLPRIYSFLLGALVVACALRAWLWSERLALLEFVVPATIVSIAWPGSRRRLALAAAPFYGFLIVFGLFSAGEYFRSWQFYQATWSGTFMEFAWARFVGYYATALNNGALLYALTETNYFPMDTAVWFYKLPFLSLLDPTLPPADPNQALLTTYANPEFNNTSGLFQPFLDFGPVGGIFCWGVLGLVSGWLFKSFAHVRLSGLVLFPVWYIGVLEILRIFYWGESRFFPVLLVGICIAMYLRLKGDQLTRRRAAKLMMS
jgi:oligosaccharide repeat unit polymerase